MRLSLWSAIPIVAWLGAGCSGGGGTGPLVTSGTTANGASGSTSSSGGTSGGGTFGTVGSTGATGSTTASGGMGSTTASSSSSGGTTTAGPWPQAHLTVYGAEQGLPEGLVDASVDEAQNIWAVSNQALYILRPGQSSFRRYTAADGLDLANAGPPGIMAVGGGRANQGFVGYNCVDITDTVNDPNRTKGGLDVVDLKADGSLGVTHLDFHNDDYAQRGPDGGLVDSDFSYHEDRGPRRFLFDHQYHPGTLYIGWNHGVDRLNWNDPDPTSGLPYADHIHPSVYTSDGTEMAAEWRALALDPTSRAGHSPGVLWMGGEFTAGAIDWTSVLYDWARNADNPFVEAFGPYTPGVSPSAAPPVFPATMAAQPVNIRAIAITPDGTVWFASGPQWNPPTDQMWGLARWDGGAFTYYDPRAMGLPTNAIMDMVAMPDGTLEIGTTQGLFRYDPSTKALHSIAGLPSDSIERLYLDPTVTPPALYVATDSGLAVLRD